MMLLIIRKKGLRQLLQDTKVKTLFGLPMPLKFLPLISISRFVRRRLIIVRKESMRSMLKLLRRKIVVVRRQYVAILIHIMSGITTRRST
ncbi:hypothetical protein ANAPC3_01253 [Anaplasma phagocytophilum]|nr:hypothetical protein ANAPC3_01253 [Anaplasma phagocytophilum]